MYVSAKVAGFYACLLQLLPQVTSVHIPRLDAETHPSFDHIPKSTDLVETLKPNDEGLSSLQEESKVKEATRIKRTVETKKYKVYGCAAGSTLEKHPTSENHGDVCRSKHFGGSFTCPIGCEYTDRRKRPYCRWIGTGTTCHESTWPYEDGEAPKLHEEERERTAAHDSERIDDPVQLYGRLSSEERKRHKHRNHLSSQSPGTVAEELVPAERFRFGDLLVSPKYSALRKQTMLASCIFACIIAITVFVSMFVDHYRAMTPPIRKSVEDVHGDIQHQSACGHWTGFPGRCMSRCGLRVPQPEPGKLPKSWLAPWRGPFVPQAAGLSSGRLGLPQEAIMTPRASLTTPRGAKTSISACATMPWTPRTSRGIPETLPSPP